MDINLRNKDGETVLFGLCTYGKFEVAKFFIEQGAVVNIRNNRGQTALFGACYNGHTQLVKLLVENGIDILAEDKYDKSAYSFALERKHQDIFKFMGKRMVKNLYESFQYSDYEAFRRQVIDTIDEPARFLIKSDHLKALRVIDSQDFNESAGEFKYLNFFRSFDFQEKLLEDLRNNLQDQLEILEIGCIRVEDAFPNLLAINDDFCFPVYNLKCSHLIHLITEQILIETICQEKDEFDRKIKAMGMILLIRRLTDSIKKYLRLIGSLFELITS
jgi:hypothetical protein